MFQIACAVVQTWQYVTMKIDHFQTFDRITHGARGITPIIPMVPNTPPSPDPDPPTIDVT
jgi:hypothetical protein